MKVRNTTKFSTELIREIIRFVKPPGIGNVDIKIKTKHDWCGYAYVGGVSMDLYDRDSGRLSSYRSKTPLIMVGVPKGVTEKTRYRKPRVSNHGGAYLPSVQFTPVEDMVHLLAHELRHRWQWTHKGSKRGRVWGSRGVLSERDADAYAIRKTREWRRK